MFVAETRTGWPKELAPFLYALTLPNISRFYTVISLPESGKNL